MKIKQMVWLGMLLSCYAGAAYAENVLGTVTSIDPSGHNVTVRRSDTNGTMTIHMTDSTSLHNLAAGSQVNLNATRSGSGWEAQSFNTAPDSVLHPVLGKDVDINAANRTGAAVNRVGAERQALNSNGLASNSLENADPSAAANGSANKSNNTVGASGSNSNNP